jgi:uncharacterized OB-fold protein
MTASELPRPTPIIDPDSKEFWDATVDGRLMICYCPSCEQVIWYPRPFCPACGRWGTSYRQSTGAGTIYAFTVVRSGIDDYAGGSYVLAYVDVDDGPRMLSNIVDAEVTSLQVGQAVEVVFHRTEGSAALPRFRPALSRGHA